MAKTGRNERCPCGSGKKYKQCHGATEAAAGPRSVVAIVLVAAALALGVGSMAWAWSTSETGNPGQIWSPEHGHWHDANGGELGAVPSPAAAPSFTPQPAGEAPPGKVWSPEHGHWHDA